MTNQNPTQGYETGIFNQLVKVSEENAVIKYKLELVEVQVNKVPTIESRLDAIESRLVTVEGRLDAIEVQVNKIPGIESQIKGLDDRLQKIENIPQAIKNGTRWIIITIIIGIIINIFSTPIIANLFN